jgi:hypothetical protein
VRGRGDGRDRVGEAGRGVAQVAQLRAALGADREVRAQSAPLLGVERADGLKSQKLPVIFVAHHP